MSNKVTLTITFDNQKALNHFARWLCGSGEQDYWNWMEMRESEDEGPITAVSFDYWGGSEVSSSAGNEFMPTNEITTECGRLADEE